MSYEVEMISVDELKPYENNPRINDRAVQKVVSSIKEVGWRVPIIVDEERIILAGHTRLKAAKVLGIKEVPVHISKGLTDEQKTVYRIMDNKSSEFAEWDNELLTEEFAKLTELDYDLNLSGFDLDEIQKLTKGVFAEFVDPESDEFAEDIIDFSSENLLDSNIKQLSLLYSKEKNEEILSYIESLKSIYKADNSSDVAFIAIKNEYEKNS